MKASAVHDAAKKFAELQQKMMQGGWRPGTQYPEPQQVLEDVLSKSVTGFLSPAQRARYKEEIDKRIANRKQVALDNLVAKLDSDLVLTALQREKISESLSSHWNDSWSQSMQMLMNIEHFFPNIPDNLVALFLTENQKKSWQRHTQEPERLLRVPIRRHANGERSARRPGAGRGQAGSRSQGKAKGTAGGGEGRGSPKGWSMMEIGRSFKSLILVGAIVTLIMAWGTYCRAQDKRVTVDAVAKKKADGAREKANALCAREQAVHKAQMARVAVIQEAVAVQLQPARRRCRP